MLRDSADPGSMFVDVVATPGEGVALQWRDGTGTSCGSVQTSTVAAPSSAHPVWVKLVKDGGDFTGFYSLDGNTWTEVGSTTDVNFSNVNYLAGLAVTSHKSGTSCTATFDNLSLSPSLPYGWSDNAIGAPSPRGTATFLPSPSGGLAGGGGIAAEAGVYTITGGGTDIFNAADQFQFASQTVTGDQTLIARVTGMSDANAWSKAGVMFRDNLPSTAGGGAGGEGSAMYVDMVATPASGVSLQWRNATGAECASDNITSVAAPTAANPVWVMLVKSGSLYTGYYSHDGSTWTEVGSISLNFSNSSYLAGLAVTSHASGTPCTATFDNVTLTANLSDNMALNAPVSVSSAESSATAGANAVDANASTAWTSGPGGPQTLTVNLGSVLTVNQVQLSWGAAYAKAYQIQVSSNDSSWTTIYSTTTGQGGVQLLTGLSGSGQYVRLDALQGVQARFSLDAFAVYPLTLTWAGGSAAWGPDNADWIGPGGKLQTWQNGSDVVFAGMPGVVSLFGQVSPHEIAFGSTTTTGGYLIQAGADPAGDQIVLPSNGAVINVGAASTSGGTAGGGSDTINALISAAASTSELTKTGGGLLALGARSYPGQTNVAAGSVALAGAEDGKCPRSATPISPHRRWPPTLTPTLRRAPPLGPSRAARRSPPRIVPSWPMRSPCRPWATRSPSCKGLPRSPRWSTSPRPAPLPSTSFRPRGPLGPASIRLSSRLMGLPMGVSCPRTRPASPTIRPTRYGDCRQPHDRIRRADMNGDCSSYIAEVSIAVVEPARRNSAGRHRQPRQPDGDCGRDGQFFGHRQRHAHAHRAVAGEHQRRQHVHQHIGRHPRPTPSRQCLAVGRPLSRRL